jgi:hypothetical protein
MRHRAKSHANRVENFVGSEPGRRCNRHFFKPGLQFVQSATHLQLHFISLPIAPVISSRCRGAA